MSEVKSKSWLLEAGIGLCLSAIGFYFASASWRLPAGPDPSAPGPGVTPGILGAALAVFGIYLGIKALFDARRETSLGRGDNQPVKASGFVWLSKPVIAVTLLIASALTLEPLGFMLSTFLFLVVGFSWLGDARLWAAVSASAVTSVSLWLFFTKLLGVGLPFGRLVEILFY